MKLSTIFKRNVMKYIFLITLSTFISCGKTKNEQTSKLRQQKVLANLGIDSDGDGLSDSYEKSRGLNPLVANIPNITVCRGKNFKLSYTFFRKEDNVQKTYLESNKYCKSNYYSQIKNLFFTDKLSLLETIKNPFNEYQSYNITTWSQAGYHKHLHWINKYEIISNFNIEFEYLLEYESLDYIQEISTINATFNGMNGDIYNKKNLLVSSENISDKITTKLKSYKDIVPKIFKFDIGNYNFKEEILKKSNLELSIKDFTFKYTNITDQMSFKKLLNTMSKTNYKLSIFTKKKTYTYYISTKLKVSEFIRTLKNSEVSNSGLIRRLLSFEQETHGKWLSLGTNSKHLNFYPIAGESYSLVYISNDELSDTIDYKKRSLFSLVTKEQKKSEVKVIEFKNKIINNFTIDTLRKKRIVTTSYTFIPRVPHVAPWPFKGYLTVSNTNETLNTFNDDNDILRICIYQKGKWYSLKEALKDNLIKLSKIKTFQGQTSKFIINFSKIIKNLKIKIVSAKNPISAKLGFRTADNIWTGPISYINLFPVEVFNFKIF
jgi:hypothetical protein